MSATRRHLHNGKLGLFFLGLLLSFLFGLTLFLLDVFIIDAHGFVNLGSEGRLVGGAVVGLVTNLTMSCG
jgi:ABC-type uncharacterized transport system permease subunit